MYSFRSTWSAHFSSQIGLFIFLSVVLFAEQTAEAQPGPLKFNNFTIHEGLADKRLSDLMQDSRGFLWIATDKGLVRFDGNSFVKYPISELTPDEWGRHIEGRAGIGHRITRLLYEDSHANIWIASEASLDRLNPETNRIDSFPYHVSEAQRPNKVLEIAEDSLGVFWLLCRFGKSQVRLNQLEIDGAGNAVINTRYLPFGESQRVEQLHVDHDGIIWAGSAHNLYYLYNGGANFEQVNIDWPEQENAHFTAIQSLEKEEVWVLAQSEGEEESSLMLFNASGEASASLSVVLDTTLVVRTSHPEVAADRVPAANVPLYQADSLLWMGGQNLVRIRRDNLEQQVFSFQRMGSEETILIEDIVSDGAHSLWLRTNAGLMQFDTRTEAFIHHKADPANRSTISSDHLTDLLADEAGIVWVATEDRGLNQLDRFANIFPYYRSTEHIATSLDLTNLRQFIEGNDGSLFFAVDDTHPTYDGGVYQVSPSGRIERLYIESQSHFYTKLHHDNRGHLWVGTFDEGLYVANLREKTVEHFNSGTFPLALKSQFIHELYEDASGLMWIGLGFDGGLHRYDIDTGSHIWLEHNKNDSKSLSGNFISSIYEANDGVMWIGTNEGGLNAYENGEITRYYPELDIFDILPDSDHGLWLGTYDQGLVHFDISTATIRSYTSHRIDNTVYSMEKDPVSGYLWLNGLNGLTVFDPDAKEVVTQYDRKDGLEDSENNRLFSYGPVSGMFFYGGASRLEIFNPTDFSFDNFAPRIALTSLTLLGERFEADVDSTSETNNIFSWSTLELDHDQNNFSIEFAPLHFSQAYQAPVSYKLLNYDNRWTNLGDQRRISYLNLSPGNYTLALRALSATGIAGPIKELGITIKRPWYQPPLQVGIALISLLVCSLVYYIRRDRKSKQQKKLLREDIQGLALKVNDLRDARGELEVEIGTLQHEKQALSDEKQGLSEEVRILNVDKHDLETKLEDLKEKNQDLVDDFAALGEKQFVVQKPLSTSALQKLRQDEEAEVFTNKLREVIEEKCKTNSFKVNDFAHEMAMSTRSLQDKLTKYRIWDCMGRKAKPKMLIECKIMRRAIELLGKPLLQVKEVAAELGYSKDYLSEKLQNFFGMPADELRKVILAQEEASPDGLLKMLIPEFLRAYYLQKNEMVKLVFKWRGRQEDNKNQSFGLDELSEMLDLRPDYVARLLTEVLGVDIDGFNLFMNGQSERSVNENVEELLLLTTSTR